MAIIYSYPDNENLLLTDMLIGTSTIIVHGRKKNITKNFTLESLGMFISENFPAANIAWGDITGNLSNQTDLQNALNAKQANITLTTTGTSGLATFIGSTLNIPDYGSGYVTPTLQSVTEEGNTTTEAITIYAVDYESVLSAEFLTVSDLNTNSFASLGRSGELQLSSDGVNSSALKNSNVAASGVVLQFPNKIAGEYTVATSDDLPTATSDLTNDGSDGINPFITAADIPASLLVALPFTTDHLTATNNAYVIGDVVWYLGNVYRCIANNDSILPTSTTYWTNLGAGNPLVEQPSDWNSTSGNNQILNKPTIPTGTVTSVGLTMPSAFSVANSPITSSGTLAVTGAGVASQYIRGDGSLANFPTSTGGGASLSFYLNGSVSQGTIGGVAFKEMDRTPILGAGTDFTINANGYIQSFITDANVPNLLEIPAGNWNFETYFSASSGGGSPSFYVELYKWNGTTLSLIASNSATPEGITNGTAIDLYVSALAVPQTTLLATDRLAVRIYVTHSGRTIKLHTENSHLCQVITTFSTGLTALNGLTTQVQSFATGTSGTDFAISSATSTHTFNLPTASAANRGALSSTDWNTFNGKFTLPALTSGSVLFSDGTTIAQKNAQLFWDNTNNRLGIGTATPTTTFQVLGTSTTQNIAAQTHATYDIGLVATRFRDGWFSRNLNCGTIWSNNLAIATTNLTLYNAAVSVIGTLFGSGNLLLSTGTQTDAGFKLDVNGTARVSGNAQFGTGFYWDNTNNRLGIGTATPSIKLQVETSVNGSDGIWIRNTNTGTLAFGSIDCVSNVGSINLRAHSSTHSVWANTSMINSASAFSGGMVLFQGGANPIAFWTNSSERLRIHGTTGNILINTTTDVASSKLTIASTTQGFLPPRMTTTQKNAIATPAAGLVVYDTTLNKLCLYTTTWETITSL